MMLSYHYAVQFAKEQKEVFGGDMGAFLDVAIECIEKQIPKKPNTREQGSTTVTRGFCTECLRTVFSFDSYCPTCGQAIDWSGEE